MLQTTLKNPIEFCGIGLHTGESITVGIVPAPANTGITFIRKDLEGAPHIKVEPSNVVSTSYATTLGTKVGDVTATVSTVEHILSAFMGMGIDNAIIEIDGCEVPIMDGSSALFIDLIKEAGIKKLTESKRYIKITKPMKVRDGEKFIKIYPTDEAEDVHSEYDATEALEIDYTIDFEHPVLSKQRFKGVFSRDMFDKDIASARTFCFLKDVEALQANGLARGGSLKNAVVIGEDEILNEEGLRHSDEFVRHKVLDLIGDLAVLGLPIKGRIVAYRSGHGMNYKLVEKLLANTSKWEVVDTAEEASEVAGDAVFGKLAPVVNG